MGFFQAGLSVSPLLQHVVPTGGVSPAGNIYPIGLSGWGGVGGLGSASSVLLLAYIDFDVDLSTR